MNIFEIIKWWEDELTSEERGRLLGVESWTAIGGVKQRHKKIREMYKKHQAELLSLKSKVL